MPFSADLNARISDYLSALNAASPHTQQDGTPYATFAFIPNPARNGRYHRINGTLGGQESVHSFVDASGNVYKPAGYKTPAKGIRYNLLDPASFAAILRDADWSGRYLYSGYQSHTLTTPTATTTTTTATA